MPGDKRKSLEIVINKFDKSIFIKVCRWRQRRITMKNEMYERIIQIVEDDEIGRISRERIRNRRNRKR